MFENIINSSDPEVVQNIIKSICGIVESYQGQPKNIEEFLSPELCKHLLLSFNSSFHYSKNLAPRMIKTLATIIRISPELTHFALKEKIGDLLYQFLTKHSPTFDDEFNDTAIIEKDNTAIVHALIYTPKDLMSYSLSIVTNVFPDVSIEEGANIAGPYKIRSLTDTIKQKSQKRMDILNSDSSVLIHFSKVAVSLLIDVYSSTVDLSIRRTVLSAMLKIASALSPENLFKVVENLELSLLLSSILSRNDNSSLTVGALEIGNTLLSKLPDVYVRSYFRGGMMEDVRSTLNDAELAVKLLENKKASDKEDSEMEESEEEDSQDESESENLEEDDEDQEEEDDDDEEDTEENISHTDVKYFFFDSDLSEVLLQDSKNFMETFNHHLKSVSSESLMKERDQLISLSKEIENDTSNFKTNISKLSKILGDASEFELLNSHVLQSVYKALTDDQKNGSVESSRAFLEGIFDDGSCKHFELLVERLTVLLARFEKFEVVSTETDQSSPAGLARQLRINLAPLDKRRRMKPITISIQAIATFTAVEEFFKHKLDIDMFNSGSRSHLFDRMSSTLFNHNHPDFEEEESNGDSDEDMSDRQENLGDDWHLEFYLDGQLMVKDSTVYGAVYKYIRAKEMAKLQPGESLKPNFASSIWSVPYQITFKKVPGPSPKIKENVVEAEDINQCLETPASFGNNESVSIVIRLLCVLFNINNRISELYGSDNPTIKPIAVSKFLSSKLTAKLNRQLEEPLIVVGGILPDWTIDATQLYPFLFPFETRFLFLESTSFGYSRLIFKWLKNHPTDRRDTARTMGRLVRQKVRVSRNQLLKSASKVLDLYGSSPYTLEVEFFEDVGTGLGPTLEFYACASKEFTKKNLNMWRNDHHTDDGDYVFCGQGLYPLPYQQEFFDTKNGKKILGYFKTLGIFVARAMLDSRIIDLNFNPVFFRSTSPGIFNDFSIGTVSLVDPQLAKSLKTLQKYVNYKRAGDDDPTVDGAKLSDLSLDFTYPGLPQLHLRSQGDEHAVTLDNLEEYIEAVVDMTVGFGVESQINAFREGFSQVFPYAALNAFNPEELVVICGQGESDWSYETLVSTAKADHGYTLDSRIVKDLFEVMGQFTKLEQKSFLQFVTGSPNLPIGGFKSLNPPFTIVCRESEAPLTPDDYLPTVMTCVNYFKLPNYSSKEILKQRLATAINEGSGSFLLS